jgi:hypothetical protein
MRYFGLALPKCPPLFERTEATACASSDQLLIRPNVERFRDGIIVLLILDNARSPKPIQTGGTLRQNASFRTRRSTCQRA